VVRVSAGVVVSKLGKLRLREPNFSGKCAVVMTLLFTRSTALEK
jgi:hypothetical protein